jgi:hypothetical protein
MNFSPFFPNSGGFANSAGLALSFSGAGVAAHNTSDPKKSETEMMRQIRIDLLDLDLIRPPKPES